MSDTQHPDRHANLDEAISRALRAPESSPALPSTIERAVRARRAQRRSRQATGAGGLFLVLIAVSAALLVPAPVPVGQPSPGPTDPTPYAQLASPCAPTVLGLVRCNAGFENLTGTEHLSLGEGLDLSWLRDSPPLQPGDL